MTNRIILMLVVIFSLISCKPTSKLSGEYFSHPQDSIKLNFRNNEYSRTLGNGYSIKGKFKTVFLSKEKTLLVCNDMILKRAGGLIKEFDDSADSVHIGAYSGYKNLGSTVFEITFSKDSSLTYRQTYTNELMTTKSKGNLIRR